MNIDTVSQIVDFLNNNRHKNGFVCDEYFNTLIPYFNALTTFFLHLTFIRLSMTDGNSQRKNQPLLKR